MFAAALSIAKKASQQGIRALQVINIGNTIPQD